MLPQDTWGVLRLLLGGSELGRRRPTGAKRVELLDHRRHLFYSRS